MIEYPSVTVVVLNFNGLEHLGPCFESLKALTYPDDRVALHLVDNGSGDSSVEFMTGRFPEVKVTGHGSNIGFSAAMNRATEAADTPLVAFLNNDTRVDPQWLTELVKPLVQKEAVSAGSYIVDWKGQDDLFQGGGCNFHGIGFQAGLHDTGKAGAAGPDPTRPVDVLFACGAAMVVDREIFQDAGGFDEDFFAFYEDVDLGWRLWILGHKVVWVPTSVVYHHHSATASRIPIHQLRVLHARNPLLTILKNYEKASLDRILPAALMLSLKRMAFLANLDTEDFRIGASKGDGRRGWHWWRKSRRSGEDLTVAKVALSDLVALDDLNRHFDRFLAKRNVIQDRRRRSDQEILPLFRQPFWLAEQNDSYRRLQDSLVEFFGIDDLFNSIRPVPES